MVKVVPLCRPVSAGSNMIRLPLDCLVPREQTFHLCSAMKAFLHANDLLGCLPIERHYHFRCDFLRPDEITLLCLSECLGKQYVVGDDRRFCCIDQADANLSCSPRSSQVAMLGSSDFCWAATQARLNSEGV